MQSVELSICLYLLACVPAFTWEHSSCTWDVSTDPNGRHLESQTHTVQALIKGKSSSAYCSPLRSPSHYRLIARKTTHLLVSTFRQVLDTVVRKHERTYRQFYFSWRISVLYFHVIKEMLKRKMADWPRLVVYISMKIKNLVCPWLDNKDIFLASFKGLAQ